jgi:hypothetical protein
MGWQLWLVAPGRRRSSLHPCSPSWSSGAPTLTDVASSRIAASSAGAAARARGQPGGPTLSPAYGSSGNWENHPTMDRSGSALFSPASGAVCPSVSRNQVRRRRVDEQEVAWGRGKQDRCLDLQIAAPSLGSPMRRYLARHAVTGGCVNYPLLPIVVSAWWTCTTKSHRWQGYLFSNPGWLTP